MGLRGQVVGRAEVTKVTDLRKPVAATPQQERMCLCVCGRGASRFFPALRCWCEQPKYLSWARKGGGLLFAALLPPVRSSGLEDDGNRLCRLYQEPPLSLVILARCLVGNQPSGLLHGKRKLRRRLSNYIRDPMPLIII
ncbi:unnamed protein product [Pleuronectes platessa]|uniref:Uncharacterized protein n=1 Tax=Pleuronectes platessa TaxID=8262 RepID=A0A9N7V9J8_PLEPL|nr:unnamed protein product [Pleuronectes platessa]